MHFQFLLPITNSDLLSSSGSNYYVKHLYAQNELPEKLKECLRLVYKEDPFYIFDHFDTFFTIIESKSTDANAVQLLMRSFNVLHQTMRCLAKRFNDVLGGCETNAIPERNDYLNLTKMVMFLSINTVKRIDAAMLRTYQEQAQHNLMQKKRAKPSTLIMEQYPDWENNRASFLQQLFAIMQFPIENLWNPPVVEENFVQLICDICYRTLEILEYRQIPRTTNETIFHIFGTAIKRFNHGIYFPVRILQVLRTIEHASEYVATGINLLHEECSITRIFGVLISEIVESLSVESNDTVISRNFSNFLCSLSDISPKLMIPHLSTLGDELLNCESHILRNCLLDIMGNSIVNEMTAEDLPEDMKEVRNEFLETLLAHINDVSAFVRSKVLQIWTKLKDNQAVPLSFQLKVLREASDRLDDKTSTVRKHAVELIISFLEKNLFAPSLTLDELRKKHEEEVEKMERLAQVCAEERKKAEKIEAEWNLIVPELQPVVESNIRHFNTVNQPDEVFNQIGERVFGLLIDKKYDEAVTLVRKADVNVDVSEALSFEDKCEYFMVLLRSYVYLSNGCKSSDDEMGTAIKTVQFLQDSIEYTSVVTRAVPKVQLLLLSKVNSDVFEAVNFFTTGYLFGIKGTEGGMRQMLFLVWSSDKEKRDAVCEAYKKVLFTTDQTGRSHAVKVVQNLSRFLDDLDYGHYTAMQCLMREWVNSNDIDGIIIQLLFERFTMKLEGTTPNESRLALQLLIMASKAKYTIASANLKVIESIGLGDRGRYDYRIYTACLEFMLNSIDPQMSSKYYKRYDMESELVQKVIDSLERYFFQPKVQGFDNLAMKTLEFFYHLCQTPDKICEKIIVDLIRKIRAVSVVQCEVTPTQQAQALETPFSQQVPDSQIRLTQGAGDSSQLQMHTFLLTRLVFIVGYMTLKEMIFLDIDVYNNMKYRQELTESEEKKKNDFRNPKRRTGNLNLSATESLKRLSTTAAEPQQEPDEDLVGATAEDNIAELINFICEEVLLYNPIGYLSKIYPCVMEICKYPAKYKNANLQQAATLAFIRFMTVSSKFCEGHIAFLMNILSHTKNIKIKCNIVIGLADLTFRFPNIIEPWQGHFYSTLHEKNDEIRLTAVKMLSQLILHEMIRVKGQIADLAMCIVDTSDEIRNITQQFFKEISIKSNILYNVLPDIISKLSDTSMNVEEDKYHTIMRYILGLIQKDRQVETLVEKLCLRFTVTKEERQWRDMAYCLSLLSYNERAIKKLIDNIKCFKDKVQVDEVYQSFKLIISNTSKLAKPELKTAVTELEARINECLEVRDEQAGGDFPKVANPTKPSKNKKPTRGGGAQRNKTGRRNRASSTDASSDSSNEAPRETRQRKVTQAARSNPKSAVISSSESSSDEDEGPPAAKSKKTAANMPAAKSTRTRVLRMSDSSNNEGGKTPQQKRKRTQRK